MNLLLVGALSWNPERIRSLHERGHRLWGLWSRSMAWDQGPYPALADCVTVVAPGDAARTIGEQRIDCVYALFQVYHPRLWGAPAPGIEHDVWTLLRRLVAARARGEFDAPIVFHWGFDVQNLAPDVVRALDGHVFCNREKAAYWTTPLRAGGCGVDAFDAGAVTAYLDGDRPRLEFMGDDFAEPLSARGGDVHTVCSGRPFGIDYLAAARRGIHVHLYGNSHDDVWRGIARDLPLAGARREARLLRQFVHVQPSLQTTGADWDAVRRAKSAWVREFSRYDAGWSYVGSPLPWEPLDDRAAIPNRLSTYVLAGLPAISDVRPGYYRYDELVRLGVNVDLDGYDALRARLDVEVRTRAARDNARRVRAGYSFDASIDPLLATLERARGAYFARPAAERMRRGGAVVPLLHFNTSPDPRAVAAGMLRRLARPGASGGGTIAAQAGRAERRLAPLADAIRQALRRPFVAAKSRVLARWLEPVLREAASTPTAAAPAGRRAAAGAPRAGVAPGEPDAAAAGKFAAPTAARTAAPTLDRGAPSARRDDDAPRAPAGPGAADRDPR